MSNPSPLSLLFSRRFFPIFTTQFLGAFNDNLFRQAVIILITFQFAEAMNIPSPILTNLAVGLFILPFFLFSALAGQLADKYEKTTQIIWIKAWEVVLMILGAISLSLGNLWMMIAVLAGLGLQSTFFGPIKYGVLPDLMRRNELLGANALVEAATFIAILTGTIIGGLFVLSDGGLLQVSYFMIGIAVVGVCTGAFVPKTGQAAPDLTIQKNIFGSTRQLLRTSWQDDVSRRAIISISWIWLLGTLFIAQIPDIVKNRLHGDEQVVTLFMASFSVGIGVGSILCSRLLKGAISAALAPKALITLSLATATLFLLIPDEATTSITVVGLSGFLESVINWAITLLLGLVAVAAGVVIVPLYAILQDHTDRAQRSRIMAATNIVNSGFMAGGSLVAAALVGFGITSPMILLIAGVVNMLIIGTTRKLEADLTPVSADTEATNQN